ncbi:MAG TPA: ClbS/DfsB family four-helix bundle protein [Ktedonobacterales bacterium]|jgi:hypothetical protein
MTEQQTKAALLDKIATSYAHWQALVDQVPRERMTEPGFAGDWSLKDVIAHITVYERWTADNLEADARGESVPEIVPWGPPPPADADMSDMNVRNAAFRSHFEDMPLDDALAAAKEHHQRLLVAIQPLADADLTEAGKFAWTHGHSLWDAIEGDSFEHYDDHQPGVRAWLDAHQS